MLAGERPSSTSGRLSHVHSRRLLGHGFILTTEEAHLVCCLPLYNLKKCTSINALAMAQCGDSSSKVLGGVPRLVGWPQARRCALWGRAVRQRVPQEYLHICGTRAVSIAMGGGGELACGPQQLRCWCRWRRRQGPVAAGPLPSLRRAVARFTDQPTQTCDCRSSLAVFQRWRLSVQGTTDERRRCL